MSLKSILEEVWCGMDLMSLFVLEWYVFSCLMKDLRFCVLCFGMGEGVCLLE